MLDVSFWAVDQMHYVVTLPKWRQRSPGREFVMRSACVFAAGLMIASMLGGAALAQERGPYKVIKIQLTGGEGGWDYVTADPEGRHLFVARSGPTGHIGIYNLDTLEQVGDIPHISAHGGAVDTETGPDI
jgi:hypothetical protein